VAENQMHHSPFLHQKLENYSIEIQKQISLSLKPPPFRKIIPIHDGIQFPVNEEVTIERDLFLFHVTAI